jgi:hypothetical protein
MKLVVEDYNGIRASLKTTIRANYYAIRSTVKWPHLNLFQAKRMIKDLQKFVDWFEEYNKYYELDEDFWKEYYGIKKRKK